jgi:hypothetical protein
MAMFMKIIREPLFHFLLLGAAIFAVYSLATRHKTDKPGEIVVTQGTIENLVTGFTRTWQRPPTQEELQGLVRDYIREEAAYREALALGLDQDDMIVRRRLQQKLEFLSDNLATRNEPSDEELQSFLQAHVGLFKSEPLFSFRQIYFNPQLHGGNLQREIARALEDLERAGSRADSADLGDPFLLERSFENVSLSDVKRVFGDQFASALAALRLGTWQGPIDSGYGTHLVFLSQRSEGRLPALDEVRDQVRREWLDANRKEATDRFYQAILSRYKVKIEPPEEKKVAQVHE